MRLLQKIREKLFGTVDLGAPQCANSCAIVIYSTRFCPYCMRARSLLTRKGWDFKEIAVDGNSALRSEMIEKSGHYTVPQIWIGDKHIGGCDELHHLEATGQLESLVNGENE